MIVYLDRELQFLTRSGPQDSGQLWWMGRPVATFSSLAAAKTTAKAANRLLRRMLRAGSWESDSLRAALLAWLQAASGGSPGLASPALNLVW